MLALDCLVTVDVVLNTAAVNFARVAQSHRCRFCSGMSCDINISLKSDCDLLYERVMKPLRSKAELYFTICRC